jgi:hypothetical protein
VDILLVEVTKMGVLWRGGRNSSAAVAFVVKYDEGDN